MEHIKRPYPSLKKMKGDVGFWLAVIVCIGFLIPTFITGRPWILFGALMLQLVFMAVRVTNIVDPFHRKRAVEWSRLKHETPHITKEQADWLMENGFKGTIYEFSGYLDAQNKPAAEYGVKFENRNDAAIFEIAFPGVLKRG